MTIFFVIVAFIAGLMAGSTNIGKVVAGWLIAAAAAIMAAFPAVLDSLRAIIEGIL